MGGCSAINCSNRSEKGTQMHRFPADNQRKKIWIINCRRDKWIPGKGALLCNNHFEESQLKVNRVDGKKFLKKNAVPTLFNVPNPPQTVSDSRVKGIGCPKPNSLLSSQFDASAKEKKSQHSTEALLLKIAMLEQENESLKKALQDKDEAISSFLSKEQVESHYIKWTSEKLKRGMLQNFTENFTKSPAVSKISMKSDSSQISVPDKTF